MIEIILIIILVLLSLSFAFIPHTEMCQFLRWFLPNCFPHWVHIGGSIVFFTLAVILYNSNYILRLKIQE